MYENSTFTLIPTEYPNKYYIQLPDGYRLIFVDGVYYGRYNPDLEEAI